jgi:MHS family proline/betaine transporter-like MFS transporter
MHGNDALPPPNTDDSATSATAARPSAHPVSHRQVRLATAAGFAGSFVEYFDFTLYGLLTVYFAPQIFPAQDATSSVLTALLVFAGGYLTRPVGAVLFGHIGDRYGRRTALTGTVLTMSASCLVLGVVPTYATIGIWAPLLVVLARLAQGLSAGGEQAGAVVLVLESGPDRRRGLLVSLTPMGSGMGVSGAAAAAAIAGGLLTDVEMATFGWRLLFLTAVPLALLTLWLRSRLEDSPEFRSLARDRSRISRVPIRDTVRKYPRTMIVAFLLGLAISSASGLNAYFSVFLIGTRHLDADRVFTAIAIVGFLGALIQPLAGAASDRFGRRPVLAVGFGITLLMAFPIFLTLDTATSIALIGLVLFVHKAVVNIGLVTVATVAAELFPLAVRYSGSSVSTQIGATIASGFAPFAAAQLVLAFGSGIGPALWTVAGALIGLATLSFTVETGRTPLIR